MIIIIIYNNIYNTDSNKLIYILKENDNDNDDEGNAQSRDKKY